ncbi:MULTISPECIES: hypothetical protein [unclassified Microcoleus]|nr:MULTISPECIES: hypothetical protein [unclassified Microcoleus]MCC3456029.1 hypothetical protein [Microcoleus sp. PH2017_08_TRC_O_A]MCC3586652.1 hypothetical protein [Microcoleus sp. PH2017_30_WIL_O_A]MCC3592575.1 hypothetical protein [Microcoleus sp. PH2017_28_MFU_U_A]
MSPAIINKRKKNEEVISQQSPHRLMSMHHARSPVGAALEEDPEFK